MRTKAKPVLRDKNRRQVPKSAPADKPMTRFLESVPDDEFTKALESQSDTRYQQFLLARADPVNRGVTFNTLCRRYNITLQDVDELWRSHQLHLGMIEMMTRAPQILRDVAEDAMTRMGSCPRCDGLKVLTGDKGEIRTCPVCEGLGKVRVVGDRGARDLVFESIGLTGKRGPVVAIQQNFGLDLGLEDVLTSAQRVIQASPLGSTAKEEE